MRINISFNEAVKYTFLADWFYNLNNIDLINAAGAELVNVIQDDYFNGADKAVNYIGYSLDKEYFEFDLLPG